MITVSFAVSFAVPGAAGPVSAQVPQLPPSPAIVLAQAAPVPAADVTLDAAAAGRRRINLAGRQRMLTQFMAKAICLVSLGVGDKDEMTAVWAAEDLFGRTLANLKMGSGAYGIPAETDPAIIAALALVSGHWTEYGRSVERGDLDAVIARNVVVLDAMNEAVGLIEKRYAANGSVRPAIAAAINIAGRQRMLTQRASKEFCLIAADKDTAANRASLKQSVALFETSMRGLAKGDAAVGLEPAPGRQIAEQIATAQAAWQPLKVIFDKVAGGAKPTPTDIDTVARTNVAVLADVAAIVELYEKEAR